MLKRIYIDNYKCFQNFELQLGSLTLLLGRNGSGKTALLEVLQLLGDFARGSTDTRAFKHGSRTRWDSRVEQAFEIEGQFVLAGHGGNYKYRLVIEHLDSLNSKVSTEELFHDGERVLEFRDQVVRVRRDDGLWMEYPGTWRRSAIALLPPGPGPMPSSRSKTYLVPMWFREWLAHLRPLRPQPWRMSARIDDEQESLYLAADLSNFAAWYRREFGQQMERQREFEADLTSIVDGFRVVTVEPTGRSSYELGFRVDASGESGRTYVLGLDELSDGQRCLVALYALLRFAPEERAGDQTICIDEPDNFVALAEIQPWLMALRDRVDAEDRFQALITSHHPEVINYLAGDCGRVLERVNGGPTRVRPFVADASPGLSPAETVARDRR